MRNLEWRSVDWRFQFRGPVGERSDDIVLVLVTEEAPLPYRSPIPRDHLAAVIEKLSTARLVGLDIFLDRRYGDVAADERLRRALADNGKVVAVSMIDEGRQIEPLPFFAEALLDIGYARLAAGDSEQETIREGTVSLEGLEDGPALSFGGALHAAYLGIDGQQLRRSGEVLPDGTPLTGNILINFSGPPNAVYQRAEEKGTPLAGGFAMVPSHHIAAMPPPLLDMFFKDKVVLIGTGLDDAPDRFRTPFFRRYERLDMGYEKMLGVEIHAHFLQTLIDGKRPRVWGGVAAVCMAALLAAVVAFCVLRFHAVPALVGTLAAVVLVWIGGFWAFDQFNQVLPLVLPSVGMALAYGLATAYQARTEGRDRRQTRRLFERYLSPTVVGELLEDPGLWTLTGKRMDITVMFADLEGFTPVSEMLTPEELVSLINEFLGEMTALILDEGGTIDKYEGDLIMAFFGAPIPLEDHAQRACRTALRMQARMRQLRKTWSRRGLPELRVRIGLHSGPAIVGNMGSEFRFNYTAMGDTVNLASRLEGANKEYGTYVMLSQVTRQMAGPSAFRFRDLGTTRVKGKKEEIDIYELVVEET